jgi:DNA-directed RNA polymerase specialized sigma24 family protein
MSKDEPIFQDFIETIDLLLEKQRRKWQLKAAAWMDYDDVKQIIRLHIYNKWYQYKSEKPIEPWANRIIANQMRNLLRNNYKNFARPCLECPHNAGGNECLMTKSNMQDSSCSLYKKWSERKRDAYNVKLPVSLENHDYELEPNERNHIDIEGLCKKVNSSMKERLNERYYTAYIMLFIEERDDEEVAEYMGYKSTEKNRNPGYKQIKNLKEMFRKHVVEILESEDIVY